MIVHHGEQTSPEQTPLSKAVAAGGMVYVSGQVARNPDGSLLFADAYTETLSCIYEIEQILKPLGLTLANVVKTTIWISDPQWFAEMNRAYRLRFSPGLPARSCLASGIVCGAKVEIEAVAIQPKDTAQ